MQSCGPGLCAGRSHSAGRRTRGAAPWSEACRTARPQRPPFMRGRAARRQPAADASTGCWACRSCSRRRPTPAARAGRESSLISRRGLHAIRLLAAGLSGISAVQAAPLADTGGPLARLGIQRGSLQRPPVVGKEEQPAPVGLPPQSAGRVGPRGIGARLPARRGLRRGDLLRVAAPPGSGLAVWRGDIEQRRPGRHVALFYSGNSCCTGGAATTARRYHRKRRRDITAWTRASRSATRLLPKRGSRCTGRDITAMSPAASARYHTRPWAGP